jgi:hypothetical protein
MIHAQGRTNQMLLVAVAHVLALSAMLDAQVE